MNSAPRKPKQLFRKNEQGVEPSRSNEQYLNYDLFNNEEQSSFLSSSQSYYTKQVQIDDESRYKARASFLSTSHLDLTVDEETMHPEQRTSVRFAPLIYLFASFFTLFGGIITTFHYESQNKKSSSDLAVFPLFRELPFKQIPVFQLGITITSLIGIINYCVSYFVWKESKYGNLNSQFFNCFVGIASQLAIMAFVIIPASIHPHNSQLRFENYVILNIYIGLSFIYQAIYMYSLSQNVTTILKKSSSYQIRMALFTLGAIVLMMYILTMVSEQEWMKFTQLLNANSICAYFLFSLNTVFISSFYFDLQSVNIILRLAHIEEVKTMRKANKNIL